MKKAALFLVLMLSLCASSDAADPVKPVNHLVNNGRYILYQTETRATSYLLDNQTGTVWHTVNCQDEGQPRWECWERMDFINKSIKHSPRPVP